MTTYFLCDKPESNARITWNVRLWGSTVARSTAYMREGRRTIMDHGAGEPDICICTVRTVLPFVRFCVYTFLPSTPTLKKTGKRRSRQPGRHPPVLLVRVPCVVHKDQRTSHRTRVAVLSRPQRSHPTPSRE